HDIMFASKPYRSHYVRDPGCEKNKRRPAVVHTVVDRANLVVILVARSDEHTANLVFELSYRIFFHGRLLSAPVSASISRIAGSHAVSSHLRSANGMTRHTLHPRSSSGVIIPR